MRERSASLSGMRDGGLGSTPPAARAPVLASPTAALSVRPAFPDFGRPGDMVSVPPSGPPREDAGGPSLSDVSVASSMRRGSASIISSGLADACLLPAMSPTPARAEMVAGARQSGGAHGFAAALTTPSPLGNEPLGSYGQLATDAAGLGLPSFSPRFASIGSAVPLVAYHPARTEHAPLLSFGLFTVSSSSRPSGLAIPLPGGPDLAIPVATAAPISIPLRSGDLVPALGTSAHCTFTNYRDPADVDGGGCLPGTQAPWSSAALPGIAGPGNGWSATVASTAPRPTQPRTPSGMARVMLPGSSHAMEHCPSPSSAQLARTEGAVVSTSGSPQLPRGILSTTPRTGSSLRNTSRSGHRGSFGSVGSL